MKQNILQFSMQRKAFNIEKHKTESLIIIVIIKIIVIIIKIIIIIIYLSTIRIPTWSATDLGRTKIP